MDPNADPDPAIYVIDVQDADRNKFVTKNFSAFYFFKEHLHHFSKIKVPKEVTKEQELRFSYYFCLMMEGSGSRSIPLTNGPDPRGPKTWGSGFGSGALPLTLQKLNLLEILNCRSL
jgi:hypothetical protein